jgi:hypothetical protein
MRSRHCQRLREIHVEFLRDRVELLGGMQDLHRRYDRDGDAGFAALFHERVESPVFEEHLAHDIVGPRVDLFLEVLDVHFQIGGFEVFLGIPGDADAEIDRLGVQDLLEVDATA